MFQPSELKRQEDEFRELFGDVAESETAEAAGTEDDLIAEFRSDEENSSADEDEKEEEEEEYRGTQVCTPLCSCYGTD